MRSVGSERRQARGEGDGGAPVERGPTVGSPGTVPAVVRAVGPWLRRARLARAKSIEEASRETRIRPEYLRALERDRFEELGPDVYVRGFLRSYASYLGLDPDQVVELYERGPRAPAREEGSVPQPAVASRGVLGPSWPVLMGAAVLVLAAFGALGLLSRSPATPPAAVPAAASPVGPPRTLTVGIRALERVGAEVVADGEVVFRGLLRKDESRSFEAHDVVEVRLARGGVALITLNGVPTGVPGSRGRPLTLSFRPEDAPSRTPTPVVTAGAEDTGRSPSGNNP